jgi:hypothetical protein
MMEGEASVNVVEAEDEEEDWERKPLQRPLLAQVLKAHCESLSQAALKLPHERMVKAVVP